MFGDKDLPTLVTRCKSVEELRQVVLYISYFDYDMDADDELGGVCLYLKDYLQDVKTGEELNGKDCKCSACFRWKGFGKYNVV